MESQEHPPQESGPADAGHHGYEIIVNMRPQRVESDIVTFDEIVKLAPNLPSGPTVEYKVAFEHAVDPKSGTMIQGEKVQIRNGSEFVVTATNRS